jgi:hypothetical protein
MDPTTSAHPKTFSGWLVVHDVLLFPCSQLDIDYFWVYKAITSRYRRRRRRVYDSAFGIYDASRYTLTEIDHVEREALAASKYSLLSYIIIFPNLPSSSATSDANAGIDPQLRDLPNPTSTWFSGTAKRIPSTLCR